MKASTIYNESISKVTAAEFSSLTTPRDRVQIYNSRKNHGSLSAEYISIMQMLQDKNSVVARFSMDREETPVV